MTNSDRIINFLKKESCICDDCLSEKCKVFPRQQVNSVTRMLSIQNKIQKQTGTCVFCSKDKLVSKII